MYGLMSGVSSVLRMNLMAIAVMWRIYQRSSSPPREASIYVCLYFISIDSQEAHAISHTGEHAVSPSYCDGTSAFRA